MVVVCRTLLASLIYDINRFQFSPAKLLRSLWLLPPTSIVKWKHDRAFCRVCKNHRYWRALDGRSTQSTAVIKCAPCITDKLHCTCRAAAKSIAPDRNIGESVYDRWCDIPFRYDTFVPKNTRQTYTLRFFVSPFFNINVFHVPRELERFVFCFFAQLLTAVRHADFWNTCLHLIYRLFFLDRESRFLLKAMLLFLKFLKPRIWINK